MQFLKVQQILFFFLTQSLGRWGIDVNRGQELVWQGAGKSHQTADTCFLCLAPSESHTKAISLAFDAQLSDGHSLLEQAMLPPCKKVACS